MRGRVQARIWAALILGVGAATLTLTGAAAHAAPSRFDRPLRVVRLPLPRDPLNLQAKARLSCFYFPGFMVKQVDLGEVGAEQLSILPSPAGGATTPCRRENQSAEHVVASTDWNGYFSGAKGGYLIFDADDGVNGGMGFAVFDGVDGHKLFEDVAKSGLKAVSATPSGLSLRYTRVFSASCSLRDPTIDCWRLIKAATGLVGATPPDCVAAYTREQKRTPAFAKQMLKDPTVVDYDVTATVKGAAKTLKPLSGKAIDCRPAD